MFNCFLVFCPSIYTLNIYSPSLFQPLALKDQTGELELRTSSFNDFGSEK